MLGILEAAAVRNDLVVGILKLVFQDYLPGNLEDFPYEIHILDIRQAGDVALRDDNDVERPAGLRVVEGEDVLSFLHHVHGNLVVEDKVAIEVFCFHA